MTSERIQRQIDRLLDEAEQALAQLDWSTLRDRSQAVLAVDPENGDALRISPLPREPSMLCQGHHLYGTQPYHRHHFLPPLLLSPLPSPTAGTRSSNFLERAAALFQRHGAKLSLDQVLAKKDILRA